MTDLEELLARRASADATLDFESDVPADEELPGRIAALANGLGGCLFLGVSRRRRKSGAAGRLTSAPGISEPPEIAILRLRASLDRIHPPVAGVRIRVVATGRKGSVIEVLVPPSDVGPHAVGGVFRVRRGPASEEMTAAEIADAGRRRDDVSRALADLFSARLALIRSGPAPVSFAQHPPLLAAHLVPREALVGRPRIDYTRLDAALQYDLRPLRSHKGHGSFDDDGFVTTEESDAYTRLLRDGTVEAVGVVPRNFRLRRLIDVNLVGALRDAVCRYTRVQEILHAAPPFFLSVALLDSQGYTLGTSGSAVSSETVHAGPAIVCGDPLAALKDVLDRLWQTTGQIECPFIDPAPPRR